MAGLYNGYILEFPQIRVDCFTPHQDWWSIPSPDGPSKPHRRVNEAQIFLLTHVHTDHLKGLSDQFQGTIVCTPQTKRMLRCLEYEKNKKDMEKGHIEIPRKKFPKVGWKVIGDGKSQRRIDGIITLEYDQSKVFELGYADGKPLKVTITALCANHCPGSAMFLVTSSNKAVLHTGDIRADTTFLERLRVKPALAPFLRSTRTDSRTVQECYYTRRLDRIYLDTSMYVGTCDMPSRLEAIDLLLDRMELYPADTIFYLNIWCFGWEDILTGVAKRFNSRIHVDRYKHCIYQAVGDQNLLDSVTPDIRTRFHACERFSRCKTCWTDLDKRIVEVSMVEGKVAELDISTQAFKVQIKAAETGHGDWPTHILCPFARHSPFPELQELVGMFDPRNLSANTIEPANDLLEYRLMPEYFSTCLSEDATRRLKAERDAWQRSYPSHLGLMPESILPIAPHLFGDAPIGCQPYSIQVQEKDMIKDLKREITKGNISDERLRRGRKHTREDHISRLGQNFVPVDLDIVSQSLAAAGGLPGPGEMHSILASVGVPIDAIKEMALGYMDFMAIANGKYEPDGYDTDEDKKKEFTKRHRPMSARTSIGVRGRHTTATRRADLIKEESFPRHPSSGVRPSSTIRPDKASVSVKLEAESPPRVDRTSGVMRSSIVTFTSSLLKERKPVFDTSRPALLFDQDHLRQFGRDLSCSSICSSSETD